MHVPGAEDKVTHALERGWEEDRGWQGDPVGPGSSFLIQEEWGSRRKHGRHLGDVGFSRTSVDSTKLTSDG